MARHDAAAYDRPVAAVHRAEPLDVAVVGRDGRTSAILDRCDASPRSARIVAIEAATAADVDEILRRLRAERVGRDRAAVVIVGPEAPLCAGLADRVEDELGIPVFGPRRAHARIEASKSWARELVERHGIPANPEHRVLRRGEEGVAEDVMGEYAKDFGGFVVKPDGLTGGKGVRVSGDHLASVADGATYARELLAGEGIVLVEQRLDGEEFSLQTVTDGTTACHLPLVQDHKRAFEGDTGPNTGGMGSYSMPDHSLPWLEPAEVAAAQDVNERVIAALGAEAGSPYRGVLYGGFMATREGVRLVEFNCRLGDPEATNVLSILSSDLVAVAVAATEGRLAGTPLRLDRSATVCKYVVPEGYPAGGGGGAEIDATGLARLVEEGRLHCYWAAVQRVGTAPRGVMLGSRALALVGVGDTLEEAEAVAEEGACLVRGPVRHRHDIGSPELLARRREHMSLLRSGSRGRGQ